MTRPTTANRKDASMSDRKSRFQITHEAEATPRKMTPEQSAAYEEYMERRPADPGKRARLRRIFRGEEDWRTTRSAAIDLALGDRRTKPSSAHHGDLYRVRIYTDESTDPHVYDHCKHAWLKGGGSVLVVLHYFEDGSHRYVHWPMSRVVWYQVTPETRKGGEK